MINPVAFLAPGRAPPSSRDGNPAELSGAGRSSGLSREDAAQLRGFLVRIPIQCRLEIQPICVIGVAGHLALQSGALALGCPTFVKGVQDRVEEGRHYSSNGGDVEASLPWGDMRLDDRVTSPDRYNSILRKMFPNDELSPLDLDHGSGDGVLCRTGFH